MNGCDSYVWIGKNLSLQEKKNFVILEGRINGQSIVTLFSPHTWKKLCLFVVDVTKKCRLNEIKGPRNFTRKLSMSMTLIITLTKKNELYATLFTNKHKRSFGGNTGTLIKRSGWKRLFKIAKKYLKKEAQQNSPIVDKREEKDFFQLSQSLQKLDISN